MIQIYHKSNCSTSLSVLKLIKDAGKKVSIIHYLETPLNLEQLQQLLVLLNIPAENLVRKKEKIFQEKYAHRKLKESDYLKMLVKHPILMERPVVVKGKKAIIARPIETVINFIK